MVSENCICVWDGQRPKPEALEHSQNLEGYVVQGYLAHKKHISVE